MEKTMHNTLSNDPFQVGQLMYEVLEDQAGVAVCDCTDKQITEVIVPEHIEYAGQTYKVLEIGASAFEECLQLHTIQIPDSVQAIQACAFYNCHALSTVSLGKKLEVIDEEAFQHCEKLSSITYNGTIAQWSEVILGFAWSYDADTKVVHCIDGDAEIINEVD